MKLLITVFLLIFIPTSKITAQSLVETGPNIPTNGRSLWDQIVAKWQAEGKYGGALPFPFEELVAALAAEDSTARVGAVLIPRGRSLQKDAAKPHYFSAPRIVVAFGPKDQAHRDLPPLKLQSRLFIGYVESAEQLEVISYNESMGRFEFQVVTDYGGTKQAPKLAKIYYADRAVCLGCHKGQMPIFPRTPWNETSGNTAISTNIAAAMQGAETSIYHGAPVYDIDLANVNLIDDSVAKASSLTTRNQIWVEGCGNNVKDGAVCRAAFLRYGILSAVGESAPYNSSAQSSDLDVLSQIDLRLSKLPAQNFPRFVSDIEPLPIPFFSIFELAEPTAAQQEQIAIAKKLVPHFKVPLGSPLDVSTRQPKNFGITFDIDEDMPGFFRDSSLRGLFVAMKNDSTRLANAVTRLLEKSQRGETDIFAPKPFVRSRIFTELLREAKVEPSHINFCCENKNLKFRSPPEALPEVNARETSFTKTRVLDHLKEFCGRCHISSSYIPAFLSGSDQDILDRFKADIPLAESIVERIESGSMPLSGSVERQRLFLPENAEKLRMLKHLPEFLTNP